MYFSRFFATSLQLKVFHGPRLFLFLLFCALQEDFGSLPALVLGRGTRAGQVLVEIKSLLVVLFQAFEVRGSDLHQHGTRRPCEFFGLPISGVEKLLCCCLCRFVFFVRVELNWEGLLHRRLACVAVWVVPTSSLHVFAH